MDSLPHVFPDVVRIAEGFQRRASSLIGGQPFADVLGRRLLEVKLQIGIDLVVEHAACEQRPETGPRDVEPAHHRGSPSQRAFYVARIARLMAPDSRSHVSISFLRCVWPERVSA